MASGAPAALAVEDSLFRALAVLRVVVLLNAVALNLYRGVDTFDHPAAGYALLAVMVGWTAAATWGYADAARRTSALVVADVAVAAALLLLTPIVKGPWFNATVPGFWIMAALLAAAVRFRWRGGLVAGLLLGLLDLLPRDEITQSAYGNFFLLLVGGPIVGFMCGSLQQMAADRDAAQRAAAAADERARLARVVHDGVLQVLALVQRRGAELGEQGAELGRLAGRQETALRTLIRAQDAVSPDVAVGTVDVAARLVALDRPGVDVVVPGGPVELPAAVGDELVAAVLACLDNVALHVGADAPAWVLLEDLDDHVAVSVRDEGPGIAAGRLEEAVGQGRMGVSGSIRGRLDDLGGTATLSTGGYGTEWELVVPRAAQEHR